MANSAAYQTLTIDRAARHIAHHLDIIKASQPHTALLSAYIFIYHSPVYQGLDLYRACTNNNAVVKGLFNTCSLPLGA